MNVIIGIGDSWTQGEGGLPQEFFDRAGGNLTNLQRGDDDVEFLEHEYENSWVNQLSKRYYPDHVPINLGVRGYGNIAAVKSLYYAKLDKNITGGKLFFCLSGRDRFDYPAGEYRDGLRKFKTYYPQLSVPEYQWYTHHMYSGEASDQLTLMSIIEAQNFAYRMGLQFYFMFAFDNLTDIHDSYNLSRHIEWGNCLTKDTTFFDLIMEKDDTVGWDFKRLCERPYPSKHFTNCLHPTIEGYSFIADHIYDLIKEPEPPVKTLI